jgi:uncharacterized protein YggT (Ycf19 family)
MVETQQIDGVEPMVEKETVKVQQKTGGGNTMLIRTSVIGTDTILWPVSRAINIVLSIIELGLSLRFFFRLVGANPASSFVRFLYDATDGLMAPFSGIFAPVPVVQGGFIDWSVLVAMLIYALVGYVINEILAALLVRTTSVVEE